MSKKYVKVWEEYNGRKLPDGCEIHHIDGNNKNNDPKNLMAVSIEEHLNIHLNQGDHGAVKAILIRMNMTDEQKELLKHSSSELQKKLWKENRHNFQKLSKDERKELSRKIGYSTLENKVGIHAINADPEKAKENARNAGLKSAELCAGFLDTKSENHGSKYVKETKWWTHRDGSRKRSKDCPGEEWQRGMKFES